MKSRKSDPASIPVKKKEIPESRRSILEEGMAEFKKNPKAWMDWDIFVKEGKKT